MNETWVEKTELYINGGMNEEERLLFEKEIAANDELSSYVNLYRHVETTMRNKEKHNEQEEALKASVKKLNAIYFDAPANVADVDQTKKTIHRHARQPKISIWKTLAVAASVIGIIAIGVLWYMQGKKMNEQSTAYTNEDSTSHFTKTDTTHIQNAPSNTAAQNNTDTTSKKQLAALTPQKREALFKQNFEADATPENTEGSLEDAFTYYNARQYDNAATEFSTADQSSTRGSETDPELTAFYAYYYAGISYLAVDEINKAIPALNKALTSSTSSLDEVKTQWYLALAYIKTGETDKATELLTKLSSNTLETKYRSKASGLLTELK